MVLPSFSNAQRTAEEPSVSVIVPTYLEAENLRALVPRLAAALESAGLRGEIVVVDDDSRDGTEELCAELARVHPLRLVVRRGERGLATAVIRGMREASGEVFVVMDADLSHPPEKVPELVSALSDPAVDIAVGSRYVPGGGIEEDWGRLRRLDSWVATTLARPLTGCKDPMAGFFAVRRSTVEAAQPLEPIGYRILLEIIVRAGCRNIAEVPIFFATRRHGRSKLDLKERIAYLRHLEKLYAFQFGRTARLVRFLAVGASGMVVDLATFAALLGALPVGPSRALAIWVAMTWNFFWNRRWTFADARPRPALAAYALFSASCLLGAAINYAISVSLIRRFEFFDRRKCLAALLGIAAGTGSNYIFSALVAFRSQRKPRPSRWEGRARPDTIAGRSSDRGAGSPWKGNGT